MNVAQWIVILVGVLFILTWSGIAATWSLALARADGPRRVALLPFIRYAPHIGASIIIVLVGLGDATRLVGVIVGVLLALTWLFEAWLRRRWLPILVPSDLSIHSADRTDKE
jgi:hypothetical protein